MYKGLFLVHPFYDLVDDGGVKSEPPVFRDGFASIAEDEFPVPASFPWKSYVHEIEMGAMMGIGILDGLPNGDDVWMQPCRVPQLMT